MTDISKIEEEHTALVNAVIIYKKTEKHFQI